MCMLLAITACTRSEIGAEPTCTVRWGDSIAFDGIRYHQVYLGPDASRRLETLIGRAVGVPQCAPGSQRGSLHRISPTTMSLDVPNVAWSMAGFSDTFRIVGSTSEGLTLYEATVTGLRTLREFAGNIQGDVVAIEIRSGGDGRTLDGVVDDPQVVRTLISMLLDAPNDPGSRTVDGPTLFLDLIFENGPPSRQVFFVDDQRVFPDLAVPDEFADAILQARLGSQSDG